MLAISQAQAQQLPILASDGSTGARRSRFASSVNYTPLGADLANQEQLFIVPSVVGNQTVAPARVIEQQVDELIDCLHLNSEEVFQECGISFNSQCLTGAGDLDTEFFAGYFFSDCLYGEAFAGIRWPTGKCSHNPQFVFRPSLGNNGHYEGTLGLQGLWQIHAWLKVKGDFSWHKVFRSHECVASAFQGNQIKNIGVPTPARISWNYILLHADLLITPPSTPSLGLDIGYELYHKKSDRICFTKKSHVDCVGNVGILDGTVLARNTKVTGHKIRGEVFWKCNRFDVFGGGSFVFAGKNVPKESDWHLGAEVYF